MSKVYEVIVPLIFVVLLPSLAMALFTQIIYNAKIRLKPTMTFTILETILVGTSFYLTEYVGMPFKTIVTFVSIILLVRIIFKLNFAKCFISFGLYAIILGIGNAVAAIIFSIYKLDYQAYENGDVLLTLIAHVTINIVLYLIPSAEISLK